MSVELRGSMLIYTTLSSTSHFSTIWRRFVFLSSAVFFYYIGALPNELPFFIGVIIADFSIDLQTHRHQDAMFPTAHLLRLSNIRRYFRHGWPIVLTIFALFVGSYPVLHVERTRWSSILSAVAVVIFPSEGSAPKLSHKLTDSHSVPLLWHRLCSSALCFNPSLLDTSTLTVESDSRVSWKDFFRNVFGPRYLDKNRTRLGSLCFPTVSGKGTTTQQGWRTSQWICCALHLFAIYTGADERVYFCCLDGFIDIRQ
jgi:hypothetical protein